MTVGYQFAQVLLLCTLSELHYFCSRVVVWALVPV